jgi:uncharacterized protein YjbJ (UPF0337 family)
MVGFSPDGYVSQYDNREETMSFLDKIKNKAQVAKGQVKEQTGKTKGDSSLEGEGKLDQVAGNLKQAGEKVKDAFEK